MNEKEFFEKLKELAGIKDKLYDVKNGQIIDLGNGYILLCGMPEPVKPNYKPL